MTASDATPRWVDLAGGSRLALIAGLELRGHLGDADLDDIIATVADACRVPMAAISIVTPGRQTHLSELGLGAACSQVPDELSFCAEVVSGELALVVPDARLHPVYANNPLALSGALTAYAGEPLLYGGHVIGTLSIFDVRPRYFTPSELGILRAQARVASAVLRLRALAARDARSRPVTRRVRPERSERALSRAISDGQLVLHYHPVMDLSGDRLVGVEALVRWQHPTRGLLPPLDFIPFAEASGLIGPLGDWVLRTAAEQAKQWSADGRDVDLAINLSPLQLSGPEFAGPVLAVLDAARAPVERIVLEVTESALMDQPYAAATLEELSRHGLRLALDDFGTGYASFSYLRRFPIDIIKIDRSFVAGLGRHADDEAIVTSIVGLARNTGKSIVAEGIELPQQAALLRALGVEFGQGFLWTEPLPADQVEHWAAAHEGVVPDDSTVDLDADGPPRRGSARAVIFEMHAAGASLHTIAAALNSQGRLTETGVRWHERSVAKIVVPPGRTYARR